MWIFENRRKKEEAMLRNIERAKQKERERLKAIEEKKRKEEERLKEAEEAKFREIEERVVERVTIEMTNSLMDFNNKLLDSAVISHEQLRKIESELSLLKKKMKDGDAYVENSINAIYASIQILDLRMQSMETCISVNLLRLQSPELN